MKRKNQLSCGASLNQVDLEMARRTQGPSLPVIQKPSLMKVKLYRKRYLEEYIDYSLGGSSERPWVSRDEDECEYDRKKRSKINNGVIYTLQKTITKNKNNIPSYIN